MTRFVSMNENIPPTSMLRFSSTAANSTDLLRRLNGRSIEDIAAELGPEAALFAENNANFGNTISESKSVVFDNIGRIVQFNIVE